MLSRGIDLQKQHFSPERLVVAEDTDHAAGAFIPRESEHEFIQYVNELLAGQCTKEDAGHR